MDFDFSDDQYLFRDSLRKYLDEHFLGPTARQPRPSAQAVDELWHGLSDLGVFSMLLPEELGGLGLGWVDLSLLIEEFGRKLAPTAIADTLIATEALVRFGGGRNRSLLEEIARGRKRISIAAIGPDSGYSIDEADCKVAAGKLSGTKILVSEALSADHLLVLARNHPEAGFSLVLVGTKSSGITFKEHDTIDVSSSYYEVTFHDVRVEAENVVTSSQSAASLRHIFDCGALAAATHMAGISGAVFEKTVEYVKQRSQFGKPLGAFQAIKHRCADMLVALESSRSAAYYASWTVTNLTPDLPRAVSIAKSFCGDSSRFICDQGTQLHGGMGFTWQLGLHLFLRRSKMLEYAYGDAVFHRKRVLAETLRELRVESAQH